MFKFNNSIKYPILLVAIGFIFLGLQRKENRVVLQKAINICLECIGLA